MKCIFVIVCFLSFHSGFSQMKFLSLIDTNFIDNPYFNDSTSMEDFYDDPRLNEVFNPLNPDIELLNAGLFSAIQRERKRRGKSNFEFSDQQYTLCKQFLDYYVPDRFSGEHENLIRFDKTTKKSLKKMRFPKGVSKVFTFQIRALDFKGNNFHYLSTDEETDMKLFKGPKPDTRDSAKLAKIEKVPVPTFTYRKLIDHVMKQQLKKKYAGTLFSKEYSSMACYFKVDKRTLLRNKIPELSFIMILGADRLKYMNQAELKFKRQRKRI